MMKKRTFLAFGGACMLTTSALQAQSKYPDRSIRLVVPFAPGGDGDIIGRIWTKHITAATGASMVVDNRAGAGGAIGAGEVARAKNDGYTLLLGTSTTQIINPLASASPTYDPVKDFVMVGTISQNPTCIIINPSLPVNSTRELIAFFRANPGKYAYGSAGPGTITNLTGELFKLLGGKLDVQHVPYKGGGPALQDVIAGHIPLITTIMSSAVLAQHRAGKVKILSVNSDNRLKVAPDIPTSVEAGMPEMRVQVFNAVFAPSNTPSDVLDYLKTAHARVHAIPAFIQELERSGSEVMNLTNPDQFMAEEVKRWSAAIKATQFKVG
jgi:tripartite-type tricarboxylate transporter receptor subunit TctC